MSSEIGLIIIVSTSPESIRSIARNKVQKQLKIQNNFPIGITFWLKITVLHNLHLIYRTGIWWNKSNFRLIVIPNCSILIFKSSDQRSPIHKQMTYYMVLFSESKTDKYQCSLIPRKKQILKCKMRFRNSESVWKKFLHNKQH